MFQCKIINLFFSILPLNAWRDFLIRTHIQKCPQCQNDIASLDEAKLFLIQEGEVGDMEGLWPAVKARLSVSGRKKRHLSWPRWRWAAGAVAVVVAIVVGFWFYSTSLQNIGPREENMVGKLQINYMKIEKKPAQTYVYWPQGIEMVLVWAEKDI